MNEFWAIVTDPAHIAAEAVWEAATGLLGVLVGRYWLRRHDRRHHGRDFPSSTERSRA